MLAKLVAPAADRGVASTVFALSPGPMAKPLSDAGARVYVARDSGCSADVEGGARAFLRCCLRRDFDLYVGWMYHGNLLATLLAVPSSRPSVWGVRQTLYRLGNEKWLTRAVIRAGSLLSCSPTEIIYNSRLSAAQHSEIGFSSSRASVIPNGFDATVFSRVENAGVTTRHELKLPGSTPLVGIVARYHPMKDFSSFVAAAKDVLSVHPDVHFILVGRDVTPQNMELLAMVAGVGIGDRCHMLGERADLPSLMSSLDVMCLSSAWGEGFPNVLGEAMCCGVACVSTDVGDARYVLGDCGLVVPPKDPAAMARAVCALLSMTVEQRRELGRRATERAISKFSLPSIVDAYVSAWRGAVGHFGSRGA